MNKYIYILLLIATLFVGGCSTIDDDLSECIQMRVYVDFDDPDNIEWGTYSGLKPLENNQKDVRLYLFDKNDNFLSLHYFKTQKVYELPYKNLDSIQYVAIVSNNINADIFPKYSLGDKLIKHPKTEVPFVTLKDDVPYFDIQNITQCPCDFQLKYGFIPTIRKDNEMAPHYIYVERKVGAIRCIVIGLNEFLNKQRIPMGIKDSPYTILFGETPKDISFDGLYTHNWTNHRLPIRSEYNDTIITEYISTFPTLSDREARIKIYLDNYEILKKNEAKNNAVVRPGRLTTVVINFNETYPNEGGMGITSDKWDTVNVTANF